jgi:hypothetical protein
MTTPYEPDKRPKHPCSGNTLGYERARMALLEDRVANLEENIKDNHACRLCGGIFEVGEFRYGVAGQEVCTECAMEVYHLYARRNN